MNLDKLNKEALWGVWSNLRDHPRQWAWTLFGKPAPKGAVEAVHSLANWAMNKAVALELLSEGSTEGYDKYIAICERIYSRLPDYARWRDTDVPANQQSAAE